MKIKKVLKYSLAVALVFGSASVLTGCNEDDQTQKLTQQEKIYNLAVSAGYEGTYEQWLASIRGADGEDGEDGKDGKDGATWYTGTDAPISEQGLNGDFYFDSTTKAIYTKVNGVWTEIASVKGEKGDEGTSGKDGITWHSGASTPVNSLGAVGDFYFNTETQTIYKKTGTSSWTQVAEIKDGIDGVNGALWHVGSSYPSSETGVNGDFYFDTISQKIYKKVNGSWGSALVTIEDGKDGASWLDGEVAPGSQIGKVGDFYFDTVGKDIYKKVSESQWEKLVSLDEEFEGNLDSEEMGLIRGVYYGDNGALTLSNTTFALYIQESNSTFKGTYHVADVDGADYGYYCLTMTTSEGKTFNIDINYFDRSFHVSAGSFDGEYTYIDFQENELKAIYSNGTLKIGDEDAVEAEIYEIIGESCLTVVEIDDGLYVLDYVSSNMMPIESFNGFSAIEDMYYINGNTYIIRDGAFHREDIIRGELGQTHIEINMFTGDIYVYQDGRIFDSNMENEYSWDLRTNGFFIYLSGVDNENNTVLNVTIDSNGNWVSAEVLPAAVEVSTEEELRRELTKEVANIVLKEDVELKGSTLNIGGEEHVSKVVIDLNGNTISAPTDTAGDGIFRVKQNGYLTINDSVGTGGIDSASAYNEQEGKYYNDWSIAIWADGGNVVINGGKYTNKGAGPHSHYDLIYVKNNGSATINGGEFEAQTPRWTLNVKNVDTDPNQNKGTIKVYGGIFHGFNPGEAHTDDLDPDTGLSVNPHDYVVDGCVVISEDTGEDVVYIVTSNLNNLE